MVAAKLIRRRHAAICVRRQTFRVSASLTEVCRNRSTFALIAVEGVRTALPLPSCSIITDVTGDCDLAFADLIYRTCVRYLTHPPNFYAVVLSTRQMVCPSGGSFGGALCGMPSTLATTQIITDNER
jgi:hypothetical protein